MQKYTWDDLYKRADGAACGEDTLKAKDTAREQITGITARRLQEQML